MWVQELFTELENIIPLLSCDISKLGSTRKIEDTRCPKYPQIGFGDIFYEYLEVCQGDFDFFLRNGNQFSADFGWKTSKLDFPNYMRRFLKFSFFGQYRPISEQIKANFAIFAENRPVRSKK